MKTSKRPVWLEILLLLLFPVAGLALGVGTTTLLNIGRTDSGNLVINLFYLSACIGLVGIFGFSRDALGLKVVRGKIRRHAIIALTIFSLYLFFYIFVIRISGLKPFSSGTIWGLSTFAVVVIAEELYFRGILYGYFQARFSGRTALIVSSLVFGLFHAGQGLENILSRAITGWLWGSVRYATGMIFFLIFPIHYSYNIIWLLFNGNWDNPPLWAIYGLPALELIIGLAVVLIQDRRATKSFEYLVSENHT